MATQVVHSLRGEFLAGSDSPRSNTEVLRPRHTMDQFEHSLEAWRSAHHTRQRPFAGASRSGIMASTK